MSGINQGGANQFISLGQLALAGQIPESGAGTGTLTILHPFIKARDAIAMSWSELQVGLGIGPLLLGWTSRDGALDIFYQGNPGDESPLDLDILLDIALLRSPGLPDQVTYIGGGNMGPQQQNAVPNAQVQLPWGAPLNTTDVDVDPNEAVLVSFPFPQGGDDPLPLVLNGPIGPAGFAIQGWTHNAAAQTVELSLVNITAAPINIAPGAFQIYVMAVAGRATPFSQRAAAQGGRVGGLTQRYAATVLWPDAEAQITDAGVSVQSAMWGLLASDPGLPATAGQGVPHPRPIPPYANVQRIVALDIAAATFQAANPVGMNAVPYWLPTDTGFQASYQAGATFGPYTLVERSLTSHCILLDMAFD